MPHISAMDRPSLYRKVESLADVLSSKLLSGLNGDMEIFLLCRFGLDYCDNPSEPAKRQEAESAEQVKSARPRDIQRN